MSKQLVHIHLGAGRRIEATVTKATAGDHVAADEEPSVEIEDRVPVTLGIHGAYIPFILGEVR